MASSSRSTETKTAEGISSDTNGRAGKTDEQGGAARALQRAVDRLTLLGTTRDGIVVGVATVYIAGYLVWSINAWQNNLGIPPALDLQYFVAGSVPVLIVGLAFLVGRFLWNFISKVWPQKVGADATGGWRIVRLGLFALVGASLFTFVFLASPSVAVVLGLMVLLGRVLPRRLNIEADEEQTRRETVWRSSLILV